MALPCSRSCRDSHPHFDDAFAALVGRFQGALPDHAVLDTLLDLGGCPALAASHLDSFVPPPPPRPSLPLSKPRKPLQRRPIHLPHRDIPSNIPCQLSHDFLPSPLADALLSDLLNASSSWPHPSAPILGKLLSSNHRLAVFADKSPSNSLNHNTDSINHFLELTTSSHEWSPLIQSAANAVAEAVNAAHSRRRPKSPLEAPGPWRPNIVIANAYLAPSESLGLHNDRLSNLGPRPTIASLTLGATRAFRIRRLPNPIENTPGQTFDILLPHNSLLIMFPPMQEQFKHGVPPIASSLTKPTGTLVPHPISGNARINLTFRMYRQHYIDNAPLCHCNRPCQLRPVVKQKHSFGKYFWSCRGSAPLQDSPSPHPRPSTNHSESTNRLDSNDSIEYFDGGIDDNCVDDEHSHSPEKDHNGNTLTRQCLFFKWLDPLLSHHPKDSQQQQL